MGNVSAAMATIPFQNDSKLLHESFVPRRKGTGGGRSNSQSTDVESSIP